ncbi:MAG: ABC transporter ATP-binding protein [Hyphomicrobiaceae bacterium]|nr:ABC transporter ATP-binding protein [Hyphomicrobiaceae bacterium]
MKLAAAGVSKRFGGFVALRDVSIQVRERTIHSVIGPNGAGKTTLFNCLTGVVPPTSGVVMFEGRDITRMSVHRRARCGMARSFQVTNLFQNLSVIEGLRLAAQAKTGLATFDFFRPKERLVRAMSDAESVLAQLSLERWRDIKAGELSHGQQRILEVGLALASGSSTLLLDEPTAGMGVDDIEIMKQLVVALSRDHTIVLIEHNMNVVLNISTTITVMHQGSVLVEGPPEVVRSHPDVKAAYLGREC